MIYKNAAKENLQEIAQVHSKCFQGYFLTSLGTDLLEKYYESYLNESQPFIIAEDEKGEIAGFCMGYLEGSRARATFESMYKWQLTGKLFVKCIRFEKAALTRVFGKIKNMLKKSAHSSDSTLCKKDDLLKKGDLLSICVLDTYRGTDVAVKLVEHFESELKSRNVSSYGLTVLKENPRGISFYKKCGFSIDSENAEEFHFTKDIG